MTDVASAQRAIDEILEQGEGPRGHWKDAHFGQFVDILDEYIALREANPAFDPVRPVIRVNVRPAERDVDVPLVSDPVTKRVMDLFNVSYEILLLMMQRFFASTEETPAQLKALSDGTIALMLGALKPLGDLVTTLPAGPAYQGRTAGPSFELFYESDYVLPHREAAWILLTERLRQAADFCEPGGPCDPAVTERLDTIRAALAGIADTLAVHLPPRYAPEPPDPPEDRAHLLARAEAFSQTRQALPTPGSSALTELAALLGATYEAVQAPRIAPRAAARLVNSVLRPLADALSAPSQSPPQAPPGSAPSETRTPVTPLESHESQTSLWDLAVTATTLRARLGAGAPPGLLEAVAALQDLALRQTQPGDRPARIADLGRLQRELPPAIVTAKNGPYLVTNVTTVRTPLGGDMPVPPMLALCRCGASAIKPFCDGAHATSGFTDDKDPNRVPDQRGTYPGVQVTIFDNRGICQHSGRCTDRAPAAFRTNAEPFVAPSGGRLDELVRAVRDCPSGALSLAFDGADGAAEDRDLADWHGTRERAIEVTQDGPYRVTGGIPLAGADGADVPRAAGSSLEHYALCRCGHSQNKPFCSGMHWYVDFRDPARPADPTLFEWAGGLPGLTRMTRLLYEKLVPADTGPPALGPPARGPPARGPPAPGPPARGSRRCSPPWRPGTRSARRPSWRKPSAGLPGRQRTRCLSSRKSSGLAGWRSPSGPRTRRYCPRMGHSVRRYRASWSGDRGPAALRRPAGTGGRPALRPPRRPRPRRRRRSRCRDRTRRSASPRTSSRCSASTTARP